MHEHQRLGIPRFLAGALGSFWRNSSLPPCLASAASSCGAVSAAYAPGTDPAGLGLRPAGPAEHPSTRARRRRSKSPSPQSKPVCRAPLSTNQRPLVNGEAYVVSHGSAQQDSHGDHGEGAQSLICFSGYQGGNTSYLCRYHSLIATLVILAAAT